MSSNKYSSAIRPDSRLRAVVLGSALLFTGIGIALLLSLPIRRLETCIAATVWAISMLVRGWRLLAFYRASVAYRVFADGSIDVHRADGTVMPAELAPGSLLLARIAWLRVSGGGAELIAGNARESQQWRRFQVICRHLGAC